MFNIVRPKTVPSYLTASSPKYNAEDVLDSLDRMQHSKCYICESRFELAIAVEHFDSDGDRYDWHNLFLACHRCNSNLKGAKYNKMLDPCDHSIDAVRAIRHDIPKSSNSQINIAKAFDVSGVELTVSLIDNVFNLANTANRKITRKSLRKRLFRVIVKFQKELFTFCDEDSTPDEKAKARNKIVHFLRCEQEYSAFVRWIILDDEDLIKEFDQYIV
jgi:uncharacterized protein (TIGR02646 family)